MIDDFSINMRCLYCSSTNFEVEHKTDGSIKQQDMYKCADCNELSSYEGLLEIAKEEALKTVKQDVESYLKKLFKH